MADSKQFEPTPDPSQRETTKFGLTRVQAFQQHEQIVTLRERIRSDNNWLLAAMDAGQISTETALSAFEAIHAFMVATLTELNIDRREQTTKESWFHYQKRYL